MYSNQNEDQNNAKKVEDKHRFTIYFVDPIVAVAGFDEEDAFSGEASNNAKKLLKKQFSLFDIKQGFNLPLVQNQDSMIQLTPKRHLIAGQDAHLSMNPRTTAKR
jgi:hypothetical protein